MPSKMSPRYPRNTGVSQIPSPSVKPYRSHLGSMQAARRAEYDSCVVRLRTPARTSTTKGWYRCSCQPCTRHKMEPRRLCMLHRVERSPLSSLLAEVCVCAAANVLDLASGGIFVEQEQTVRHIHVLLSSVSGSVVPLEQD